MKLIGWGSPSAVYAHYMPTSRLLTALSVWTPSDFHGWHVCQWYWDVSVSWAGIRTPHNWTRGNLVCKMPLLGASLISPISVYNCPQSRRALPQLVSIPPPQNRFVGRWPVAPCTLEPLSSARKLPALPRIMEGPATRNKRIVR